MSSRSLVFLVISLGALMAGCGQPKSSRNPTNIAANPPQTSRSTKSSKANNKAPSENSSKANNRAPSENSSKANSTTKTPEKNSENLADQLTLTANNESVDSQPQTPLVVDQAPREFRGGLSLGFQGLTVSQLIERRKRESQPKSSSKGTSNDDNDGLRPGNGALNPAGSSTEAKTSKSAQSLPNRISLPVRLQPGLPAAAAEMVVSFDTSLLKFVRVRPGKAGTEAGKSVYGNLIGNGTAKLLIMGMNRTLLRSAHPVAWIDFEVLETQSTAVPAIRLSRITISDPTGQRVSVH